MNDQELQELTGVEVNAEVEQIKIELETAVFITAQSRWPGDVAAALRALAEMFDEIESDYLDLMECERCDDAGEYLENAKTVECDHVVNDNE